VQETDFIVVGSGIAGLRAALELSQAGRVTILTKDKIEESSTEYAQGGVAVVLSDDDEIRLHFEDTMEAGAGLCDADAVRVLVEDGPRSVQELIEWGCQFDRIGTQLEFGQEAAHSRRRIVHARGDSTGREIVRTLLTQLVLRPNVQFVQHALALKIILVDGRCVGVQYVDTMTQTAIPLYARAVILATGGAGQLYAHTTNPDVATGDGMAMAYLAGAVLCDMEFVQFHPTALAVPTAPRFLLTEAMRGEGGLLRNVHGERFMSKYHEKAELAPRDIVTRALITEMRETDSAYVCVDMTHLGSNFLRKRFPRVYETCLEYGIDMAKDLIPVSPAAHYFMGGVRTDLDGWTGIEDLYAAGEVACVGVHGANRLASNSLLEGLVFGARAARKAREKSPPLPARIPSEMAEADPDWRIDPEVYDKIRHMMWDKVGIIRDNSGLSEALALFQDLARGAINTRTKNFLTVAILVAQAALFRRESRGAHFRADFPQRDDTHWRCHSANQLGKEPFCLSIKSEGWEKEQDHRAK